MTPFRSMTKSTQQMIVGSLIGQTANLDLRSGEVIFVEVRGLATEARHYVTGTALRTRLVASDYYTGDLLICPLNEIETLRPRERPITDPQHPDYEDPGVKVTPIKKRRS